MNETKIEWSTKTLNPVVGCTFNCKYCYAKKLNKRFKWIENWHKHKFYPERLQQLKMKKPQNIFMNSMSDIADWEEEWINDVSEAIKENPQHNYMFLTKRIDVISEEFYKYFDLLSLKNVWLGITVNTEKEMKKRLPILQQFKSYPCKRFISIEPIFEIIKNHNYEGIDWIIVGAETGNRKEKVVPESNWVINIVKETRVSKIPLFYKESMKQVIGEKRMYRDYPYELRKEND